MILAKLILMTFIFKPKHINSDYLNILMYKLLKYILMSSFPFNLQDPVGSSRMEYIDTDWPHVAGGCHTGPHGTREEEPEDTAQKS